MKPYKFKIANCFAEDMKRQLDGTEFEYTFNVAENGLTDFQVVIRTPDDRQIIKELESEIF